jgi:hypothetical protein
MVMNCNQAREHFLDAVTPGSAVSAHVEECAACAAELKALRETMALMDAWQAPEPSAYFNTRLQARVAEVRREEAAPEGFWAWLRKPALMRPALVAAMGMAFVIGVNFYQQGVDVTSPTPEMAAKGTAVSDLSALERNESLYAEFDLLDDIGSSHAPQRTPQPNTGSEL